jgi:Tol biopolymer transport system component
MLFFKKLGYVLSLTVVGLGVVACAALAVPRAPVDPPPEPPRPAVTGPATVLVPVKSPNRLLVSRGESVSLIDPDGKNETELTLGAEDQFPRPTCVRLSPDGSEVAVVTEVTKGEGLEAKRVRQSLHVRKIREKEPGADLVVQCQSFTWSPDGTEIACNEFNPAVGPLEVTHTILSVKRPANAAVATPLKLPKGHLITDWSPDGKQFLTTGFDLTPERPRAQLFLVNRDGTGVKPLTDGKEFAAGGRLSPDGTRLLYSRMAFDEPGGKEGEKGQTKPGQLPRRELMLMTLATRKAVPVAGVPRSDNVEGYCWSPDGKKIAYTRHERPEGDPNDLKREPLNVKKETESHLVVSDPDGRNPKIVTSAKSHVPGGALMVFDWR